MTTYISTIARIPAYLVGGPSGTQHQKAITAPRGPEVGVVSLLRGWLQYADTHKARYDSGIGEDYVLGEDWRKMGFCLIGLLNGELGRLDGGSLDSLIRDTLKAEGFDPDNR